MDDVARVRTLIEPRVVDLICGLRHGQVKEAVELLLDYIDAKAVPVPPSVIGESEAFDLFRTFVHDNAKALRMVAHWGDGRCGALLDVLQTELLQVDPSARATNQSPRATTSPMFPEDGGTEGTA